MKETAMQPKTIRFRQESCTGSLSAEPAKKGDRLKSARDEILNDVPGHPASEKSRASNP